MDSTYIGNSIGVLYNMLNKNRKIQWFPARYYETCIGRIEIDVMYYYYDSNKLRLSAYETEYIVTIYSESKFTVEIIPCPSNSGALSYKKDLEEIIKKWLTDIDPKNIQENRVQKFKQELFQRAFVYPKNLATM